MQGSLAVVLGGFLGSQNERSQTGERLRHLQKLMLRGQEKRQEGRGGGNREERGKRERRGGKGTEKQISSLVTKGENCWI